MQTIKKYELLSILKIKKCGWRVSIPLPQEPQSYALPIELHPPDEIYQITKFLVKRDQNCGWRVSIPLPQEPQSYALPIELHPLDEIYEITYQFHVALLKNEIRVQIHISFQSGCGWRVSIPLPQEPQSYALPIELHPLHDIYTNSYKQKKCGWRVSIPLPQEPQSYALPIELHPLYNRYTPSNLFHLSFYYIQLTFVCQSKSLLKHKCAIGKTKLVLNQIQFNKFNKLNKSKKKKCGWRVSIPLPQEPQSYALPIELHPLYDR
ncbi:hypothetical protein ABPG74_020545 [Tetrahymena malaccensis]